MVAVPKFTLDADILLSTSSGTKFWGRGDRSRGKPAHLRLQGPIWVTAIYCSTWSSTLGSILVPQCSSTPYPRLVPSQFPPTTQCPHIRKPRGGALQKLESRALGFHHCHDLHSRGRKVFWLIISRSPLSSHGLLQLLCSDACCLTHPKCAAG